MEHIKNKSLTNYWWLFYPLLFLLIGLLIYALLWNPSSSLEVLNQQLKDCRDSHAHTAAPKGQSGDIEKPEEIMQTPELSDEIENKETQLDPQEPPKNAVVNCDAKVKSGGQGVTKTKHIMGDQSGRVILQYDTREIPDEIKVYYNGKLIAETGGLVAGAGQLEWVYEAISGQPNYCYVEVSAPTPRTVWEYIVNCPL
ncbi:MAG: hypothetical protein ACN6PN_01925 [Sphingobacterium sp.]